MTLSTSRQQFLAYETQTPPEEIGYGRRGGVFLSSCVCAGLVILAVVLAALVGIIVYYITYFMLTQKPTDFWNDAERFGKSGPPSADLRLPASIVPSYYRLKIKADLLNSSFTGDVFITIRASKKTKEIILHAKNLSISSDAKLTEQIYEKVETLHMKRKRDVETVTTNISTENPLNNTEKSQTTNLVSNTNVTDSNSTLPETPLPENQSPVEVKPNGASIDNQTQAINSSSASVDGVPKITEVFHDETGLNKTSVNATPVVTTESNQRKANDVQSKSVFPIASGTQVIHSSVRDIKITSIKEAPGDRLILTLASALKPDVDYTLQLSFGGNISNSMTGFYKSNYKNNQGDTKDLGVTQFEPTSARAAFPCFDEPSFKASFEISIAHHRNISVLSNMNMASHEALPEKSDWQWTHFERSVKMSTYLVAYVLSDYKHVETSYKSKDNVTKPIRIWARPELIKKANYALTITPKLLEFYEEVFGVPYALDKIDLVAIPDFSSGAMENWGLITFRETTLLFDESESIPRDKQSVAIDVAHELAHQWFGNLVTMRWWDDLWLNEGFASYIEYVGVDHIEPEWNMFESFTRDKMDLLRSDALKNTNPVALKVIDASEISQKFDEISYMKGANLIRMLNHTISYELFHKGLVHYLDQWKYANAEENDLWEAMTSAIESDPVLKGRSLVGFMNGWTRQAGYPVVKATRDYDSGRVRFTQNLFTSSKEPYRNMAEQVWQIPISWTAMDAPLAEWTTKPRLWLTERMADENLPINDTQPLYVNVGAIGYYRVNYDSRNWELLSKALQTGHVKSPITKAQLIDDAFNLAKASQLNYSLALSLTTCVINGEDSKIVWDLLLNNMAFLKHTLKATPGFVHFQDFMKILLKKQLERLNYGLNKPRDDNEAFLIENLVMWECEVGSDRCIQWAREHFNKWSSQADWTDNPIPSYLRTLVYHVVLKHGGRSEFEFLWRVFRNATDPSVQSVVLALPATREEALIAMLLEKSLTELPKQYAASAWNVQAPVGTAIAQTFLIDNFHRVYNKFTEMDSFTFPSVLNGAFGSINTEEELDRLKSFAVQHKQQLAPMSMTLQKLVDTASMRIAWTRQHAEHVTRWFADFVAGQSGTIATNNSVQPPTRKLADNNTVLAISNQSAIVNGSNVKDNLQKNPEVAQTELKSPNTIQNDAPEIQNNKSASNTITEITDAKMDPSVPTVDQSVPKLEPPTVNDPVQSNPTIDGQIDPNHPEMKDPNAEPNGNPFQNDPKPAANI